MKDLTRVVIVVVLVLLASSCSAPTDTNPATTGAPRSTLTSTSTMVTTTSPAAPTSSEPAPSSTSSTEAPAPYEFPDPQVIEERALVYCSSWPDFEDFLADDVALAAVTAAGWDEDTDELVHGRDAVVAALTEFTAVDCGGPVAVAGDWAAIPVSASRADGSGIEGIWVLKAGTELINWHLSYATGVNVVSPAPTEIDPIVSEVGNAFGELMLDTDDRTADNVLALMSDDPAMHDITMGFHYVGVDNVRVSMSQVASSDSITLLESETTNGTWAARGSRIVNLAFDFEMVGMNVLLIVDGKVHRQFVQFTQLSGWQRWALPADG